jgi:hypothetical protein
VAALNSKWIQQVNFLLAHGTGILPLLVNSRNNEIL